MKINLYGHIKFQVNHKASSNSVGVFAQTLRKTCSICLRDLSFEDKLDFKYCSYKNS